MEGRGHFFAAAAEAMRRILIENARRKKAEKHGGGRQRVDLDEALIVGESSPQDLLALDVALARFDSVDPRAARLVTLRYFAGLTLPEVARTLGLSLGSAERNWTYARTLRRNWRGERRGKTRATSPPWGAIFRGRFAPAASHCFSERDLRRRDPMTQRQDKTKSIFLDAVEIPTSPRRAMDRKARPSATRAATTRATRTRSSSASAFYGHIASGERGARPPFPTFEDGHREVLACEAILRSHREGRWIELKGKGS